METEDLAGQELRAMRAAWRAVAERWELDPCERGALLPQGGEGAENPPVDTETRMRLLIEIGQWIPYEGQRLQEWLHDPRSDCFWLTPLEAMSDLAQLRRLRRMVEMGLAS